MAADTSPSFTFTHIISATLVEDPREQVGTPFFSPDSRPFHSVGGRWTFYHQGLAPMRFGFRWTDLSPGLSVKSILLHLYSSVGSVLGDARVHAIDSEDVRTGRDSDGIVEDSYPMVGQAPPFKVHVAVTMKAAREPQKEHLQVTVRQSATVDTTLARVALLTIDSPKAPDVQFTFRDGRSLWAVSGMLNSASSYFSSLLSSGFAEGEASQCKSPPSEAPPSSTSNEAMDELSVSDSDDEGELDEAATLVKHSSSATPCHRIAIKDASYHTYRAVLCWMTSGFIAFTPLTSTFPSTPLLAPFAARAQFIAITHATSPDLPLPISPKSAFRLAEYLDLAPLKALALAAIQADLNNENAATELFSDTVRVYREVEDVVLDYVIAHWAQVKRSKAMVEVEERLDRDCAAPGSAAVALRLPKRLQKDV